MDTKKTYRKNWDDVKNLRFLVRFLEETGMSIPQAAEVIGTTRQTVYYWLVKDDARLSGVDELIDKCGYDLTLDLVKVEPVDSLIYIDVPHPKGEGRLSFLSDALSRYNIPKEEVSEKLGLGITTIYYWFKVNDCFISYIFKIAEFYGLKVKITIKPKQQ